MKIHYTSGNFYIEQDGKKIKIANPELLPIVKYPVGTLFQSCEAIIFKQSEDHFSNCIDGHTFDLPKKLSVEIKDACDSDCCTMDGACGSNCISPLKVAILSKSSSPEIPDSSELEKVIKFLCGESDYNGKWFGLNSGEAPFWWRRNLRAAFEDFKKFSLYPPSPPTVAGTSTKPYADFIDGSTYVKTNDSKISNSSEKPEKDAFINDYANSREVLNLTDSLSKLYDKYVIPRDKTISDLRESLKASERFRAEDAASAIAEANRLRERVKELEGNPQLTKPE